MEKLLQSFKNALTRTCMTFLYKRKLLACKISASSMKHPCCKLWLVICVSKAFFCCKLMLKRIV
jgi:hypothetical protein